MVREVRIIRRLKDKWEVFGATCMTGSLPCRKNMDIAACIASAISRKRQEPSQSIVLFLLFQIVG